MDHETKKKIAFGIFFLDVEFDIGLRREEREEREERRKAADSELRSPILFHFEQRKCVWAVRVRVRPLRCCRRRRAAFLWPSLFCEEAEN